MHFLFSFCNPKIVIPGLSYMNKIKWSLSRIASPLPAKMIKIENWEKTSGVIFITKNSRVMNKSPLARRRSLLELRRDRFHGMTISNVQHPIHLAKHLGANTGDFCRIQIQSRLEFRKAHLGWVACQLMASIQKTIIEKLNQ